MRAEAGGVAHFEAAAGPQNYVVTHHPAVLPHLTPSVWWLTSYARNPLVYRDAAGGQVGDAIIGHFVQSEIAASIGLFDRFELGFAAPAYFLQGAGFDGKGLFGGGTGDVRFVGKAQLTPWREGLTAALRISSDLLPVAQLLRTDARAATLSGDTIPNVTPSLSVGYHSRALRLAAEAGFLWRQSREVFPDALSLGSQVLYGAAAEVRLLSDDVFLSADLHGRAAPAALGTDRNRFPLQGDLALKSFIGPFLWSAGVGTGLVPDYGAPEVRVFAALGWYPREAPAPADQDGDGIVDAQDACPSVPEDPDGFEDGDGCPDDDNDKDGIADASDQCPLEPETPNEFQDEDGCPDTPPPPADPLVVVKLDRIDILEKVYFELNSDQILPQSYGILGRLARVLESRTDIRLVRVEGHTDSDGEAAYNKELSLRRAESVMRFLIEAGGIAQDRLVAEGVGESRPIDTNDTVAGKQNNRRVEFHIVEQDLDADGISPENAVEGSTVEPTPNNVTSQLKNLVDEVLDAAPLAISAEELGESVEPGPAENAESPSPEMAPAIPEATPSSDASSPGVPSTPNDQTSSGEPNPPPSSPDAPSGVGTRSDESSTGDAGTVGEGGARNDVDTTTKVQDGGTP